MYQFLTPPIILKKLLVAAVKVDIGSAEAQPPCQFPPRGPVSPLRVLDGPQPFQLHSP